MRLNWSLHVNDIRSGSIACHHALVMDHIHIVHVDLNTALDVVSSRGLLVVAGLAYQFTKHLVADEVLRPSYLIIVLFSLLRLRSIVTCVIGRPLVVVSFWHELVSVEVGFVVFTLVGHW